MRLRTLSLFALCLPTSIPHAAAQDIPNRPEDIQFAPLNFEPPEAAGFRHELSNGVLVYLAPSQELPLVNIVFTFKGGGYLDPQGQVGLVSATGSMIRRGGTMSVSAEDLDERFDFLAANVSSSSGSTTSLATLNCLASNLEECFALFMDMIRNPGFQADRCTVYFDELLERLRQRNDFPDAILNREWKALLYGRDHYEASQTTEPMVQAMSIADLRDVHRQIFHPGNLIIAVNGDFEESQMLALLEEAVSGWEKRPLVIDPPAPEVKFTPGLYHVEKDIPQGKVFIGLRTISRDHPDYFPMLMMNEILGGGGFTSRITKRVRSDEGLAYSAGSTFIPGVYFPGEFRALFQSKNPTVALSAKIILEEIELIRSEPVTGEELEIARNSFIETFPRTFESKAGMLNVFVNDEMTGRDAAYWKNYRDNIKRITAEQIMDVARRRLDPRQMAVFVVGKWDEIYQGDLDQRANMSEIFGGNVTHLPLRDPMTMEPIK